MAGRIAVVTTLALAVGLAGCTALANFTEILNPNLTAALVGPDVASLPEDAPGLLVGVENRTGRWVRMLVSYRDDDDKVENYTTTVAPGDTSAQMVVCPVTELTLGSVGDLSQTGALVYLVEPSDVAAGTSLDDSPYIEVDAFGVLLMEESNYDCGDGVTFAVQESSASTSGYQVWAYIRRSAAP